MVNPVLPTDLETPVGNRPPMPEEGEGSIPLDALGEEMMAHRPEGMSEKEFYKLVRKKRGEGGK